LVDRGECHLVVGPNGAGKSTLLRILAGLARPSAGELRILGRPLAGDRATRRGVGLLSHQTYLYDDLTAAENLEFAARLHGLPNPAETARIALNGIGLAGRGESPLRQLSRGMVQRVAIARALLAEPELLLLDEPFTGLDPEASLRVVVLLREQLSKGRGVVLVSHDLHEAWELATHAHVLVRGEWKGSGPAVGSLEGFLSRYREALNG
jgi:heme exporter protein A